MQRLGPSIAIYFRAIAREAEAENYDEAQVLDPIMRPPPKPPPKEIPVAPAPKQTVAPPTPMAPTSMPPLPEAIHTAAAKKIEAEMKPVVEAIEKLKASLDLYRVVAQQETERRVTNSILVALGQDPLPAIEVEEARKNLNVALHEVSEHAGGVLTPPFVPPTTVSEAPPTSVLPEPTPHAHPASAPKVLDEKAVGKAKALIDEIEGLSGKIKNQHPVRLFHLLKAIVAEARLFMAKLPEGHPAHERLSQLIPVLGAMKVESGITDYIHGLAFGATGEWERVSKEERKRVAQFDKDVAASSGNPSLKTPQKQKTDSEKPSMLSWPKLPRLRATMKTRPLILVGGLVINEKLDLYANRFGVKPEWVETDGDAARATETLAKRIRAKVPCAIIILEGLVAHKTSDKIVEACKSSRIPFVLGDKGGTASIETALHQIEQKLAG